MCMLLLLLRSQLVCTTITTTRKFFTILCSVLFFGHPMVSLNAHKLNVKECMFVLVELVLKL
jgi:hypothetical protein